MGSCSGPGQRPVFCGTLALGVVVLPIEGMMRKVNLKDPSRSAIHGMLSTGSMPPYPLPEVAPAMREAITEWIKAGAPK